MGTEEYQQHWVREKITEWEAALPYLPRLQNPQAAYSLLSQCVTQQATHLTRLLPPSPWLQPLLGDWDAEVINTFAAIIDCRFSLCGFDTHAQAARLQLCLPISRGGFALRASKAVAAVAYIVSRLTCVSSLFLCRLPSRSPSLPGPSIFSRDTLTSPSSPVTAPYTAATLLLPQAFRVKSPQLSAALGNGPPMNLFQKGLKALEEDIFHHCLTFYTPTYQTFLIPFCTSLCRSGHVTLWFM